MAKFIEYFGVKVLERTLGLKLSKDNLVDRRIFKDLDEDKVRNETIEKMYKKVYKNYDNNMRYFQSLSKEEFNLKLNNFLNENKQFKEITNLNSVDKKSGYYMMVLDEYFQVYIGTSSNIKGRIQGHWAMQMHLDRMIFGSVDDSKLSINSFRAFDTKRIYVYLTSKTFDYEDRFINKFDDKYLLNRTAGGLLEGLDEAIANRKTRDL